MGSSPPATPRRTRSVAWAVALLGTPALLHAAAPAPSVVPSVFHIEKSENRNQVHYAVRVDALCRPIDERPVYPYWRDLERGPEAMSRLLKHEEPAYGLTPPRYVRKTAHGGEVKVGLRGFPDRSLAIQTWQSARGCAARAVTTIRNEPAVLRSIYVEIGFLYSIDYVIVRGARLRDGSSIEEKVDE